MGCSLGICSDAKESFHGSHTNLCQHQIAVTIQSSADFLHGMPNAVANNLEDSSRAHWSFLFDHRMMGQTASFPLCYDPSWALVHQHDDVNRQTRCQTLY